LRASVGSTDASASLAARVGVVGPKRATSLFFNRDLVSRRRRRASLRSQEPSVLPEEFVAPVEAWNP
jgi:hypothetical protein